MRYYFCVMTKIQGQHKSYGVIVNTYVKIKTSKTSIDVLPSKNQALCEYCTLENIADTLNGLFLFQCNHVRWDSSLRNIVTHTHLNILLLNELYTSAH